MREVEFEIQRRDDAAAAPERQGLGFPSRPASDVQWIDGTQVVVKA